MNIKPPERIEVPEEEHMRERFGQILAVLIVIATLGVACVEFLHSYADRKADAAGVEAQKLSVERQGELTRASDQTRSAVDNFALSQEEQARGANAFQQQLLPEVQEGSVQYQQLQLEQQRWTMVASLTESLSGGITADSPNGPAHDVYFPTKALSDAQHESDRLFALEDAANEERTDWQGRVGLYSAVLTLFAVAIYLFGLSTTLQRRLRIGLTSLGIVLIVSGTLGTVVLQFTSPSPANEQAATAYADGMQAFDTFYTQPGDTLLKQADADFSQAIQLRPSFAEAFVRRSLVRFLLGSPQRTSAVVSITSDDALRSQGDDLQQAYDLGLRDKEELNDLAANRLLLAIHDKRSDYFDVAIGYLNTALQLDANDPLLYYNKGLAFLGKGDISSAKSTYQDAVDHTIYTDVGAKTTRDDPQAEENYLGGALTPLDLLASERQDLGGQVESIKELIVTGVDAPGTTPSASPLSVSAPQAGNGKADINVFAGSLQWETNLTGFDPGKDSISTQWYYQDSQKLGWSVLSQISGPEKPAVNGSGGGSDDYFLLEHYLERAAACLQPGSYRVEIYVDGHLVATGSQDGSNLSRFSAFTMPDVQVALCHPSDWTADEGDILGGFSNGVTNSDKTAGAFVFRLQNPEIPAASDPVQAATGYRNLFLGLKPIPQNTTLDHDSTTPYFLDLKGQNESWYTYDGGELRVGSGITADGAVVVGVVWGPSSMWQGDKSDLGDTIFESLIPLTY